MPIPRTIVDDVEVERLLELSVLGARQLIVAPSMERARELLHQFREACTDEAFRFYLGNGREHGAHPSGGRIHFRSWRSSFRGLSLDRAYLLELHGLSREELRTVVMGEISPALYASPEPHLVQVIGRGEEWPWPRPPAQVSA